jgi:hypothetical protein
MTMTIKVNSKSLAADGTSTTTLFKYNGDEIATIDGIGSRTDFNYTNGLITKIVTIDKATQGSKL